MFGRQVGGALFDANTALFSMEPNGSDVRRLTHDVGDHLYATASADGRRMAYVLSTPRARHGVGSNFHQRIVVMSADGTDPRVVHDCIPSNCMDPALSPDGTRVAFVQGGSGGTVLDVVNADGSGLRTLCAATCGQFLMGPTWSPDGTEIAFSQDPFYSNGPTMPPSSIFVVASDRSGLRRMTGCIRADPLVCPTDIYPAWSPSGGTIVFDRAASGPGAPGGISTITRAGQRVDPLLSCRFDCGSPVWSPDGRELALTRFTPHAIAFLRLDGRVVGRVAVCSSPVLCDDISPAVWSPDGSEVLVAIFDSHGNARVVVIGVDGRRQTVLPVQNGSFEGIVAWLPGPGGA